MSDDQTTNFPSEDYRHVADLLRGAVLDCDENAVRSILSNNINMIVAALLKASRHAAMDELGKLDGGLL